MKKYIGLSRNVIVPKSVATIGWGAFSKCKRVCSVNLSNIVDIANYAFCDCVNLASIDISDGVRYIGLGAFENCNKLSSVRIPDSVAAIFLGAFYGCSNPTHITIPKSTEVHAFVFDNCPNLTIHAPAGSYAEQYAKENGIPLVTE